MRKYQRFFYDLLAARDYVKENKNYIKQVIGDSTNNNRTVTVRQVQRYLAALGRRKSTRFARELYEVAQFLKANVSNGRVRTDSVDISELVNTYRTVVMNNRQYRQQIGQIISKVG